MDNPLVTVAIVTYNSGEFVLETLDSVKNQTYQNIELILSDDCSSDDTVSKCEKWFKENGDRFVRTEIVISDINTGVSGNGNRALAKAQGEWYKNLDGDDLLAPTAIEDYVSFVTNNVSAKYVFGRVEKFERDLKSTQLTKPFFYDTLYGNGVSAQKQYKVLSKHWAGSGTSGFYSTKVLKEIGGFDERFPLMEDHPILINLTRNGIKLWLLDKTTIYYRVSSNSISHQNADRQIFTNSQVRVARDYKLQYLRENLNAIWRLFLDYSLFLKKHIISAGNTYDSRECRIWHKIYTITDPFLIDSRVLAKKSRL